MVTLNEMPERIDGAVKRMVQFTADASHELRAPLTLIQTAAEFSLRRERTRKELLDAMRKIVRESDRTSRPVNELFPADRDEPALSRLWLILLDNAIKYTNPGGSIRFELTATNGHAEVQYLPHIFDRFWRADKVRSRSVGGSGLGLSIAQWIVERHHGSITARSEPGKGSRFTARLPIVSGEAVGSVESQRALQSE